MFTRTGDDTDTVGNIEEFLQQCLEDMEPDDRFEGPGRPRILPAMALWAGLLVCVLRGFESQLAVWRLISERGLWFFPDFRLQTRRSTSGSIPREPSHWRGSLSRSAACWQNECRGWSRIGWRPSPRRSCA